MMYNTPGQQLYEIQNMSEPTKTFRMATVERVESQRPYIRFYGEDTASEKAYKYLQSYIPAVGDKIILAHTEKTYVILGKVV